MWHFLIPSEISLGDLQYLQMILGVNNFMYSENVAEVNITLE